MDKFMKAIERQGRFGRLFVDYAGCPRGSQGRCGAEDGKNLEALIDEILAWPVMQDVDGENWIPVQADALHELIEVCRKACRELETMSADREEGKLQVKEMG